MEYDELDEIREEIKLLGAIGDKYKQLHFKYGESLFQDMSDGSYMAKEYLKQYLKKSIEVSL